MGAWFVFSEADAAKARVKRLESSLREARGLLVFAASWLPMVGDGAVRPPGVDDLEDRIKEFITPTPPSAEEPAAAEGEES